jgi:hypothetical protein
MRIVVSKWQRWTGADDEPMSRGGSIVIAILAAVWLVERAFDLKVLPF